MNSLLIDAVIVEYVGESEDKLVILWKFGHHVLVPRNARFIFGVGHAAQGKGVIWGAFYLLNQSLLFVPLIDIPFVMPNLLFTVAKAFDMIVFLRIAFNDLLIEFDRIQEAFELE